MRNFFLYVLIYILGPKLLQWNFLQISQPSIRSGANRLFCQFLNFSQFFDRNFAKIVPPPSDEIKNYVPILKGQSLLKKTGEANPGT